MTNKARPLAALCSGSLAVSSALSEDGFNRVDRRRPQNALLMTPPSTRTAAPVVADARGLAR